MHDNPRDFIRAEILVVKQISPDYNRRRKLFNLKYIRYNCQK